jgi:hypothetical protein
VKKLIIILTIFIIFTLVPTGLILNVSGSTLTKDLPQPLLAPEVQIISPKPGDVIRGNTTIEYSNFTGADDVKFSYYLDANSDGVANDGNNWHSIGLDTDLTDSFYFWNTTSSTRGGVGPGDADPVILNATSFDITLNFKSVYVTDIEVDNTPPSAPSLSVIQPNPTNQTIIMVSGTCEPFATVEAFLGGGYADQGTADNAGMFNIDLTIIEGTNTVTVWAYDVAGNGPSPLSSARTVVRDTVAPVAVAGNDRTVADGTLVTFNGSSSYDTNPIPEYNYINEYVWSFMLSGAPIVLYGPAPTYYFDTIGNYTITLMVSDAAGNWGKDTIWIKVRDSSAPIANAGPDRNVDEDIEIIFDANQTQDNDLEFNTTGNFTWTFNDFILMNTSFEFQKVQLNGKVAKYTFATPGKYMVTLTVTDASGNSDIDTMWVTVLDKTSPVSNPGNDRTVIEGRIVVFDASWSTDNDPDFNTTSNYEWRFTYNNQSIVLYGKITTFRFNISTSISFDVTLKVEDAAGNFDISSIKIYVLEDPLLPRVVNVYPLNSAINVPLDTIISVTLNEELDPSTIFRDNVTAWLLYPQPIEVYDIHNRPVNGTIEYDPNTFTLTFYPAMGQLVFNNGYTVTVSSLITDIAGNPIDGNGNSIADPVPGDDYKWVFTTVSITTSPAADQVGVPLNALINATFSGNTSELTVINSKFKVIDSDGNEIAGTNSYDNKTGTVTFQPANGLIKGIMYTAIFDIHIYPIEPDPGGVSSQELFNTTITWEFSTGSIPKSGSDEDEPDTNALILWSIYIIVIICILIVIFIFLKRRSIQPEPEHPQDQYLYEEDWGAEVGKSSRPRPRGKKKRPSRDDVVEWDEDEVQEESWKPHVVEWEDAEMERELRTPDPAAPKRKPVKSRALKPRSKKRKPVKKSKRKR